MSARGARLFLALPLGAALGDEVGGAAAALLGARDFRLARGEGLHLTLYFLGATPREDVPRLAELVQGTLRGLSAPALRLTHAGAFPRLERPRVLWVGVEERGEPGALEACRAATLTLVERFGHDPSAERARPFRPHVTVARPRSLRARVPSGFGALALGLDWDPTEIVLYESEPAAGGNRYVPRAAVGLVHKS